MTMHNSLHTGSAAHAVLSAQDGRLALAGLLAPAGPGALDVRTGVLWPVPGGFAVSGTSSTSPWQYSVPAAPFVMSKGTLDGPHVGSNDGTVLVSTTVPPASNSRYDVIYVMQQDADATISPDASTAPLISVTQGAPAASPTIPSIPAGAVQLAHALVSSTATGGTSGAGVTITQDFLWTTLRGHAIPVRNATEKAAITWGSATSPARVIELDTSTIEVNSGSGWVVVERLGVAQPTFVVRDYNGTSLPAGTAPLIQSFVVQDTSNGSGVITVTFPQAFTSPPIVTATTVSGAATNPVVNANAVTTTTVQLIWSGAPSTVLRTHVHAIGW